MCLTEKTEDAVLKPAGPPPTIRISNSGGIFGFVCILSFSLEVGEDEKTNRL